LELRKQLAIGLKFTGNIGDWSSISQVKPDLLQFHV
jgi:hypothetical protein